MSKPAVPCNPQPSLCGLSSRADTKDVRDTVSTKSLRGPDSSCLGRSLSPKFLRSVQSTAHLQRADLQRCHLLAKPQLRKLPQKQLKTLFLLEDKENTSSENSCLSGKLSNLDESQIRHRNVDRDPKSMVLGEGLHATDGLPNEQPCKSNSMIIRTRKPSLGDSNLGLDRKALPRVQNASSKTRSSQREHHGQQQDNIIPQGLLSKILDHYYIGPQIFGKEELMKAVERFQNDPGLQTGFSSYKKDLALVASRNIPLGDSDNNKESVNADSVAPKQFSTAPQLRPSLKRSREAPEARGSSKRVGFCRNVLKKVYVVASPHV